MKKRKLGLLVTMCSAFAMLLVGVMASKNQIESKAAFFSKRTSIKKCEVVFDKETYNWNIDGVTPEVTVIYNGETLVRDKDYTLNFRSTEGPGLAFANIKGIGNFKGRRTEEFHINRIDIATECTYEFNDVTKEFKFFYKGYELNSIDYKVTSKVKPYAVNNEDGSIADYGKEITFTIKGTSIFVGGEFTHVVRYTEKPDSIQ